MDGGIYGTSIRRIRIKQPFHNCPRLTTHESLRASRTLSHSAHNNSQALLYFGGLYSMYLFLILWYSLSIILHPLCSATTTTPLFNHDPYILIHHPKNPIIPLIHLVGQQGLTSIHLPTVLSIQLSHIRISDSPCTRAIKSSIVLETRNEMKIVVARAHRSEKQKRCHCNPLSCLNIRCPLCVLSRFYDSQTPLLFRSTRLPNSSTY
jgi:hypothetical protein